MCDSVYHKYNFGSSARLSFALHSVGKAILNLLLTVAVDKCGAVAKFHGENQFLVKGGPLFIFLSPGVKPRYEYRAVDTTV